MDLRHEFDMIIKEYGSEYIHIHKLSDRKCRCMSTSYESAKDDCIVCLGTGSPVKISVVSGRNQLGSSPISLPSATPGATPGKIHSETKVFYLYHTTEVSIGDYLIHCDIDENKLPIITKETQVYLVNEELSSRGESGRDEYTRVWVTNDPLNSRVKLKNLRRRMENM